MLPDHDGSEHRKGPTGTRLNPTQLKAGRCVVRATYVLRKIVGEDQPVTPEDWKKDHPKQLDVNDKIAQVLNALRLSGIENIYAPAIIHGTTTQ